MGMWMLVSSRQSRRIRIEFLDAVMRQEIAFFDRDATTGRLMTCMNEDTLLLEQAIGEKVGTFIQQCALFATGLGVAFANGWDLTLVILAMMPLLGVAGGLLFWVMGATTSKASKAYAEANSVAQQALAAIRTVFAYNAQDSMHSAYSAKLETPERAAVKQSYTTGGAVGFFQLAMYSAYALAMWYASERVLAGVYTGGQVLTVFFSALIGGFATAQASPLLGAFEKGRIAGGNLFEVIDRAPGMEGSLSGGKRIEPLVGEVELRGVGFAYPSRPDKKVFDGFSLAVPAGKTVALVGQSGSGKSTIVSLIERFYDPSAGAVLLDGVPLQELDLVWLRSQVGLVSQEPALFATTIHDNILFGRPGATEEEVRAAATAANATGFIDKLPEGYQTMVGEAGTQLSGGQKQRIAIARALLKNPRVLLLDEATSALDAQSERLVQQALDNLMAGRTTVVVAHRLSTIRKADLICVVQEGRVVEQGSHGELLRNPEGAYSQLVRLQHGPSISEGPAEEEVPTVEEEKVSFLEATEAAGVIPDLPVLLAGGQTNSSSMYPKPPAVSGTAAVPMFTVDVEAGGGEEQKKGKEGEPKAGMGRLLSMNRTEWHLAVVGCLSAAGLGIVMPAFALALSSMIAVFYIDTSTSEGEDLMRRESLTWSLIFFSIGAGSFVLTFLSQVCFGVMGARLATRVRLLLFRALLQQEVGWFDLEENNSGSLTARLGTDAQHVRGAVGDALALMTQNFFTCVAGLTIAFISGWKMTLVILAVVPFIVASGLLHVWLVQRSHSSQASKDSAAADQVAAEAFRHARVVHAYNMQAGVRHMWETFTATDMRQKRLSAHVSGFALGFSSFAMFSVYGLAFWVGGMLVTRGEMSMENMLAVFFAVVMAAMGASQAQMGFPDSAKASGAIKRIFAVVDRTPKVDPNGEAPPPKGGLAGNVSMHRVAFRYPNRESVVVFRDLSLTVPAGRTLALVGESGSGKSTVISLLERFYDVGGGAVRVDGRDLRELPLRWLRDNVGLVSQEPTLFGMSVKENIKLGRPGATDEEVEAAARTANAAGFIEELPEGYDTLLGEKGIQLSGGQKQRVAIARAVLKDPRVLLLDEATSALDAESERLVQDALEKLMAGRTTVVVAHRLSTIRKADSIAVMRAGHIVEQGSHEELLRDPEGAYASLIRLQQATHS